MRRKTIIVILSCCMIAGLTGCVETTEETTEYNMACQYFDMNEYDANDGVIRENRVEYPLSSVSIDDTEFYIGMRYDEIISLGYQPEEVAFADKNPDGLVVLNDFYSENGKSVRLGFVSDDFRDSDITVRDGGWLYKINIHPESNTFDINGINESSTISDIIDTFGNPYRVDTGIYSDFPDMKIEYLSKEVSNYLSFYVNLKTGKIVSVVLEGYNE